MTEIARALRRETDIPDGAVAVTLDDGYLNNHGEAWPILENYGVPATIYLATGYIGTGRMMWSDRLEAAILGADRPRIDIQVGNKRLLHDLSSEANRIAAFLGIKALCKASPNDLKDEIIDAVIEYLDSSLEEDHPLYAFMAWDQVREMDASPLIDFGAHTVDHVSLAKVPNDEMRDQIDRSVAALERELGHRCLFFSYPEGQGDDFDECVIGHLLRNGFDHAPSAIDGVNKLPGTDPFHLLRTMVGFEGRQYPFR
jgi:peptidoglycan/xylan/chitin deacetylase (PgdA/CDA1 family)